MLILMLFSFVAENFFSVQLVHAETTRIELIDEDYLKLDYDYKTKEDVTEWKITFKRQSESEELLQRLKLKITDGKDTTIDYPVVEHMEEKEEWLVEENFTETMEGQITLELPKSIDKLQLYVQMDQKEMVEESEIQENILEQEKPFKLEIKKERKSATKESSNKKKESTDKKKETNDKKEKTASSSSDGKENTSFIGPQLLKQAALRSGGAYEKQYVNKVPAYTESPQDGKYPTNSWSPIGQSETIKNHQGGNSADPANTWANEPDWNIAQDDRSKSYINYGDDSTNPNLAIRKLAYATEEEDEFNIRLNVRGNTTYKPGVDIVFLIDCTGTMSQGKVPGSPKNRKDRVNDALFKIIKELKGSKVDENIRIGGYYFSSGLYEKEFERQKDYDLSSDTGQWDTMVTNHGLITPVGPTFTQRGLLKAKDIFDRGKSDIKGRKKLLFVLTDGAPNSSLKPMDGAASGATRNESIYMDGVHIQNWQMTDDSSIKPPYTVENGDSLGATASRTRFDTNSPKYYNSLKVTSHLTTTNSTAYDLKQEGIEIHTVSAGISSSPPEHSVNELQNGLGRMASQKANTTGANLTDYFFNTVADTEDLTEGIKEWYETVISTVNHGIITDPISDMFTLVGKPTMKTYDADGNQITLDPKPDEPTVNGNNEIVVKNLSLKKGEQVQIDYRVKLKTGDSRFKKGVWYQTNGPTTLEPTPERSSDVLNFAVPSVRIKADEIISIPVRKVWANDKVNNTDNYWERRESVTVELQKQNGNTWTKLGEEKVLSSSNNWSNSFTNIVDVPGSKYRVVEKNIPKGHSVSYSPAEFTKADLGTGAVVVTNTLKKTNFEFEKVMNDGETHFPTTGSRPIFQVEDDKTHKTITNVSPNAAGTVTFENLPVGTYTVTETTVPDGYKKMDDFKFMIEENSNGDLITKVNGSTNRHKVVNKLKDFDMEITKTDTAGELISGASFHLRGTGTNSYDQKLDDGPTYTFKQLKPGRYLLTEVKTPVGYTGLKKDVEITISELGIVTIEADAEDDDLVEGFGRITAAGNEISLTVKNRKREGQVPSTGGEGKNKLMMVSVGLVGTSALVGLLYFILNRKNM